MTCACCIWTKLQQSGVKAMHSMHSVNPARSDRRPLPGMKLLLQTACTAALVAALLPSAKIALAQSSISPAPSRQAAPDGVTSATAEARLEALRHALIDKALESPTRIRTSAWVDETGTLRENVQINSDVRLRGIRILSYLDQNSPDQNSPEQARMVVEAEASARRLRASSCATPAPGQRIKRHAALISHFMPSDGRRGYYFVPELATEAQALLIKLFALEDSWVVTPAGPSGSSYEQALFGRDMPRASAYTMRIGLEAVEAAPMPPLDQAVKAVLRTFGYETQTLPALPLRLSLQVEERSSGRVLWRNEAMIDYPEARVSMERSPLPVEMRRALETSLRHWQKNIQQALACEPLQFEATLIQADQITIAAGNRVGIRAGDQLLLVDRSRFPSNMLEKNSLDKATLIEIQSVSQDHSLARRIAGPPPAPLKTNLVAMPL